MTLEYRFNIQLIHSFHDKIQFKRFFNDLFSGKIKFKNLLKKLNLAVFNSTKYLFNHKTQVSPRASPPWESSVFAMKTHFSIRFRMFLSPSGDLGIGLDQTPLFSPTVEILIKLNKIIYEGASVVLRMISDDFRCFPMFSAVFRLFSDDVFWLLKSSSSWTKLSMMGPQLFPG